jgi:type II secretory pathway component PulC
MKLGDLHIRDIKLSDFIFSNLNKLIQLDREKLLDWLSSPKGLRACYGVLIGLGVLTLLIVITQLNDFRHIHASNWASATQPPPHINAVAQEPIPLAQWHLFGVNEQTAKVAQGDLELRGIFMGKGGNKQSTCVIAVSGGEEETYTINDQLPDGSKVINILPDRVVIEHNGTIENLMMKQEEVPVELIPEGSAGVANPEEKNSSDDQSS